MRPARRCLAVAALLAAAPSAGCGAAPDHPAGDARPGADAARADAAPLDGAPPDAEAPGPARFGGCPVFPARSVFHADVRGLPVHPRSAAWLAYVGATGELRVPTVPYQPPGALFPTRFGDPINLADAATPRVTVQYDGLYPVEQQYGGPFPLPADLAIEEGFDQHAIVVATDECAAYELIGASQLGALRANGGARWDLRSAAYPAGLQAVTAARLPLVGFALRADEVRAGRVDHPLAFVIPHVRATEPLWPAQRTDGSGAAADAMPMGAWVRLRAGFDAAALPPAARVLAEALQVHGAVLLDSGGVDGALVFDVERTTDFTDAAGRNLEAELASLAGHAHVGDLEVVDATALMVAPDSLAIR